MADAADLQDPPGVDEVHVWYCFTEVLARPHVRAACHAMMSEAERARHDRFLVERVRDEFLLTRGLCRSVLSHYTDVAPRDWVFSANTYGRPAVASPAMLLPLRFNLSNTTGLVACGVMVGEEGVRDIGIDVEDTARTVNVVSLAEHSFSPSECAVVRRAATPTQKDVFFSFWTLKEAYIKARGMGLSIPLEHFSMHLDETPIGISFSEEINDDPQTWQLSRHHLSATHRLAVAIKRPAGQSLALVLREGLPLAV